MKKQLLITFDYELFLGNRSGTVDSCMIEPTNKLTAIMDKHGIRAVFFVDTTYLMRLRQQAITHQSCKSDFNKIADQLCSLVENGHFVYPHPHPHWLDADYIESTNQWRLNNTTKYRFTNISDQEKAIVFNGSVEVLQSILFLKFPDYKIDAFRAGGWCIQPFTDFLPFFRQHKMQYEFSVLGGFYQFTDAQHFDFSNAPIKNIYKFEDDVCIEDRSGSFTQYNISSIHIPTMLAHLNKIWLKIRYKLYNDHTFHKGEGQPSIIITGITPASATGMDLSISTNERIAVELMSKVKLGKYLDFIREHHYMHCISHPKMITSHNLEVFDKFLGKVFEKYSIETDFHMMKPE